MLFKQRSNAARLSENTRTGNKAVSGENTQVLSFMVKIALFLSCQRLENLLTKHLLRALSEITQIVLLLTYYG
jgi:hypothetical protein